MNERSDFNRVLETWMGEGPSTMPDRVIDVVADRISRRPQRPVWRLAWRRPMNAQLKLIATAAAVVVLAVAGWNLLPRQPGVGGPSPSPSATPASTAAIACEDLLPGCAGPLVAGQHQSAHFSPGFEFTTPANWTNTVDTEGIYALNMNPVTMSDPILVWSGVVPAVRTGSCGIEREAATTVDGWVAYLTGHPGLVSTNVHPINLSGSTGQALDLQSNSSWSSPCADDYSNHNVPIMMDSLGPATAGYGTTDVSRLRLYVIGIGNQTVLITVYPYSGDRQALEAIAAIADPIVATFSWACKADSPPGPCWGPPDASGNPATPPPTP